MSLLEGNKQGFQVEKATLENVSAIPWAHLYPEGVWLTCPREFVSEIPEICLEFANLTVKLRKEIRSWLPIHWLFTGSGVIWTQQQTDRSTGISPQDQHKPISTSYKLYSQTGDLDVFFILFSQTMVSVPKINNLWQSPVYNPTLLWLVTRSFPCPRFDHTELDQRPTLLERTD